MHPVDKLHIMAELEGSYCDLYHGPEDKGQHPACNCIGQHTKTITTTIYICKECQDALYGDEWVLLYCVNCNESRWVAKEFAKNKYRHHILWLNGCVECTGKFGGLYFTDSD